METTRPSVPVRTDRTALGTALLVAAFLWFSTGVVSRLFSSIEEWQVSYALFTVLVLLAAATSAGAITIYTSEPGQRSGRRIASVALVVIAVVSTIVAWAFVMWAELGPAGEYNDYSEAQDWGVTVACALATAALGVLAWRTHRDDAVTDATLST